LYVDVDLGRTGRPFTLSRKYNLAAKVKLHRMVTREIPHALSGTFFLPGGCFRQIFHSSRLFDFLQNIQNYRMLQRGITFVRIRTF
jgi:hypothetical protein